MKTKYATDIKLGERYLDPQTGLEGTATSLHFYQFSCERVTLEVMARDGKLEEYTFDSPRLENCKTKQRATTTKTGGPGDGIRQASSQAAAPAR